MEYEGRHFPNKLRRYRKIMGYKQIDVAHLLGVISTNRISRWERGLAMPSALNLLKLSILYRTLVNELYFDLGQEVRDELSAKEKELLGGTEAEKIDFFY